MDKLDETMGQWETIRGDEGAPWQAAADATFGDLPTLRDEGGVVLAGRYKVVKRLGEGGMGSVWLAEDAKLDNRKVAVKMLPAILAGKKGAYKQVKAEAMVAMKLSHPNIATVRAFEEDEGGNPFLVMDYIEGEGLDDMLAEKGALSEEETRRVLGPVAAALDYAHSKGVVHRDVKPGNVMVAKDGTPYVLDFGIAREVQETMTRVTGKLSSGTLLYMSPEQLRGKGPKASQDVYSFAAMAYECLAGRPPFFRGAIEDQIKNEPPEELPEGVGEALRAGVMAGLAKEAEGRPGSCAGVLGAQVEGQRSKVEGQRSKGGGWGGDLATGDGRLGEERGDRESRFADHESRGAGHEKAEGGRTARPEGSPHPTTTIVLPGGATMKMVWCPPGSFLMGSPSGEPGRDTDEMPHRVTLTKGFWMAKTPVTQRQWKSVMGDNPSRFKGDDLPVENVSWNDCQEFCRRCREAGVDLRLPTEAQWEYACRAGTTGPYAGSANLDVMGWYGGNSRQKTHPVGQKQPNAWGLHDMHGNVLEWCAEWYGDYPDGSVTDPKGASSGWGRVARGGSWNNSVTYCRSAYRFNYFPSCTSGSLGFRPAGILP